MPNLISKLIQQRPVGGIIARNEIIDPTICLRHAESFPALACRPAAPGNSGSKESDAVLIGPHVNLHPKMQPD